MMEVMDEPMPSERRVPHGFDLAPAERRLLRGRPPATALDWACAAAGARAVVAVRARSGGMSSAVHAIEVEDKRGHRQRLVLRRYVRDDWLAEEPDAPAREAAALRALEASAVAAPRLVAADLAGHRADVPAVLMTFLPGRLDWAPSDVHRWLDRLAEPLPIIHATPAPAAVIPPYRPYELDKELAPPRWTRHRKAWERAIEVYLGPPPTTKRLFIHRDYHPGNVLWSGQRVSGIVDWVNTSRGAPEADVGHCRANLAGHFGLSVGDRFLARYQALTGCTSYHPYWDLAVVVGPADSYGDPDPDLDEFVARAVARL
jgi:aminoglycoside phosphotransferase (APT) family kinase protein